MSDHLTLWLIGAGPMCAAHLAAVRLLGYDATVIGRSAEKSRNFAAEHGCRTIAGGVETALATEVAPDAAIIAASVDQLQPVACSLLRAGTRRLLVEKPAALSAAELHEIADLATAHDAEVYIAYNRRFYPSVMAAEAMIREDGGVLSFVFEFTEIRERVMTSPHSAKVLNNWFLANSSHVVDLAFFLGGLPTEMACFTGHPLPWHSAGVFAGAGRSESGAFFSYQANWCSGGRWGVEVCTPQRRLILRPLEGLQVQMRGDFSVHQLEIDASLDHGLKAGVFGQTQAFLLGEGAERMLNVHDALKRFEAFDRIRGVTDASA